MEVTLKELLDSRENRVWHQQELIEKYGGVLVSVTLNIPGPIKDKPEYRKEWSGEWRHCLQLLEQMLYIVRLDS